MEPAGSRAVDKLDVAILRELRVEPFMGDPRDPTPWRPSWLAPRVGAPARLVKDRLRRIREDKLVEAFEVFPNLSHFGFSSRSFGFRVTSRAEKRRVLDGARDMEGYLGHIDFLTNWLHVTLAHRGVPDGERKRNTLVRLASGNSPVATFDEPAWPVRGAPSPLDWRLLAALRGDARRPRSTLARQLHVTARTVQRRLDRLAQDGVFDTFARLRPEAFDRLLFCVVLVHLDPKQAAAAIGALHSGLYADAWSRCDAGDPVSGLHVDLVAAPRAPSELQALVREAEAVRGVIEVEAHLVASIAWEPGWVDEQIGLRTAKARETA